PGLGRPNTQVVIPLHDLQARDHVLRDRESCQIEPNQRCPRAFALTSENGYRRFSKARVAPVALATVPENVLHTWWNSGTALARQPCDNRLIGSSPCRSSRST